MRALIKRNLSKKIETNLVEDLVDSFVKIKYYFLQNKFQECLRKAGFDFGFRIVNEILRFMYVAWRYENKKNPWDNWERYFDAQIKQKMLPKIHGSQRSIGDLFKEMINLCIIGKNEKEPRNIENIIEKAKYRTAALKIQEMDKILYDQRYVSFTR